MKKKKAFTLVELIVAMAVTLILFASIGLAFYFVVASNNNALESSAMNIKVRTVREYVLANKEDIDVNYELQYNEETKALTDVHTGKEIISDSEYIKVTFLEENSALVCNIEYKETTTRKDLEKLSFVVKVA